MQCLPIWSALKAAGYTGTFITPDYTDALLKPLAGTLSYVGYNAGAQPGPHADAEGPRRGQARHAGRRANSASYFSADKFIAAVKKVGKAKLTPEAVQKVLSTQNWQIKGFAGPSDYPASTVVASPICQTVVEDKDGTAWTVAVPYSCTSKTFKVPK